MFLSAMAEGSNFYKCFCRLCAMAKGLTFTNVYVYYVLWPRGLTFTNVSLCYVLWLNYGAMLGCYGICQLSENFPYSDYHITKT